MKMNPILKRDMTVRSRSITLAACISVLNAALFLVAMLGSFGVVTRIEESMIPDYGNTLKIYSLVVLVEYLIMVLVSPLFTASAISGEREAGTLDLLLITNETPGAIIRGKLLSSLVPVSVMIISGLPPMMMPLLFGGVSVYETFKLIVLFIPEALFILCIGMFASSMCKTTIKSIALSYGIVVFLLAGTVIIPFLTRGISPYEKNTIAYMLLVNPLFPIVDVLSVQIGETGFVPMIFGRLNLVPEGMFMNNAYYLYLLTTIPLGALLFVLSILNITPGKTLLKNIE